MKNDTLTEFIAFPWNKSFETGIAKIDEQHKSMVDLVNELANSVLKNDSSKSEEIFNKLIKYAHKHFKCEEEIFEEDIKEETILKIHKDGHHSFLPKLEKIKEQNKGKEKTLLMEEILLFLIKWLAYHIIDEDKRLIFAIDNLKNTETKDINVIDKEYDNISMKPIHFIFDRTLRIKAIKELNKINTELKALSFN